MTGNFDPSMNGGGERKVNITPEVIDVLAEMAMSEGTTMTQGLKDRILAYKTEADEQRGENDD